MPCKRSEKTCPLFELSCLCTFSCLQEELMAPRMKEELANKQAAAKTKTASSTTTATATSSKETKQGQRSEAKEEMTPARVKEKEKEPEKLEQSMKNIYFSILLSHFLAAWTPNINKLAILILYFTDSVPLHS